MSTPASTAPPVGESGPAWEVARLFPDQGQWGESDYVELTRHTRKLVELSNGRVEVLSVPKTSHQKIVASLYRAVLEFVASRDLGTVLFAPLRVRLWTGKFREPDVVFMLHEHDERAGEDFWEGADLVMEVVSDDDPDRDLVTKRSEYAEAGITEYWIVEPHDRRITVLRLAGDAYEVAGTYAAGENACSELLQGLIVDVTSVFAAAASSRGT